MSTRPLAFGVRLRDKSRTVRVRTIKKNRYEVEVEKGSGSSSRKHASLGGALRDAASSWRSRLN